MSIPIVQEVNPQSCVSAAAALLQRAWTIPCIHYSEEYLRWQFSHPTSISPIVLAVKDADPSEFLGFAAAQGRSIRFLGEDREYYLSSHYCVRPGTPGTVALSIIRKQAELHKASQPALIVFVQPASIGEAMLKALDSKGLIRHSLGNYAIHAGVSRSAPAAIADENEWLAAFKALEPQGPYILLNPLHYLHRPLQKGLVVHYEAGVPTGAAIIGVTESVTARGIESLATLFCLRATSAEAIKALIAAAGGIALVPNVRLLDPAVVKAAGLRMTASNFNCYVFANSPEDPSLTAAAIEIEPT